MRLIAAIALACLALVACKGNSSGPEVQVTGAGATFPAPLYKRWTIQYGMRTRSKVIYRAVGSTQGIEGVTVDEVDFGASDSPMTEDELSQSGKVLHIPMTLGAVAVVYDFKGSKKGLKLTGALLADIYLGKVTSWDDSRISELNPGVKLPAQKILPVHRKDGSGTTKLFTEYLAANSADWQKTVGSRKKVKWPKGKGVGSNSDTAVSVRRYRGAIGYVSLSYARAHRLDIAALQNKAGSFVAPSLDSITSAAQSTATSMPADLRMSIVNAPGDDSYPISAYTYALVRKDRTDAARRRAVARFLWWGLTEGQHYGPFLHFATMPPSVVQKAKQQVVSITAGGRPVIDSHGNPIQ